jgi:hypothetical protein
MWITEFCARRASDCVEQAEACDDAARRQSWLHLAGEWAQVADGMIARNRGEAGRFGKAVEVEASA